MPSVRVISPDWHVILGAACGWAKALVESDDNVCGVLLFGSLARDEHAPGSDADLLVVLRSSPAPPAERAARLPALRLSIPADLVVYTETELEELLAEGLPFLRRALGEGRWLARRQGWQPPQDSGPAGS